MTNTLDDIKQWRAKEIAKLFLLRSDYTLSFSESYDSPFDILVSVETNVSAEFGLLVMLSDASNEEVKKKAESPQIDNMLRCQLPVLLMLIDEENESGTLDFLVTPQKQRLVVSDQLKFKLLSLRSINHCLGQIVQWSSAKNRKTA